MHAKRALGHFGDPSEVPQMSVGELYAFDLRGYVVVRNALTAEELRTANEAIDRMGSLESTASPTYAGDSKAMNPGTGLTRMSSTEPLLTLPQPYCQPFRNMLAHPKTSPHLNTILGEGWRLDHGPGFIAMDRGCEGGLLHGGAADRPPSEQYFWKNDRIMSGLTVIEYLLADEGPGDGGVCVVAGSHKANVTPPPAMMEWDAWEELVTEVNGNAGDAIIFSETCTHGTLPWTAEHQRRAVLFKYSPAHMAYSGGGFGRGIGHGGPGALPAYYAELSAAQLATLQLPGTSGRSLPSNDMKGLDAVMKELQAAAKL